MSESRSLARKSRGGVEWLLTRDFCPWMNRYLVLFKEPIGWFGLATVSSILVGLCVDAFGWVMAASLLSIMAIGGVWPWLAVRMAVCRLRPTVAEIHEGQTCELVLSVRNRWPLPLWGLAVEGYLDAVADTRQPTLALACVPPCSDADYRISICPQWRGRWPAATPQVVCAFPFGLWTATRNLQTVHPLTVWPRVLTVLDQPELVGGRAAEAGDGLRSGQAGELLGVRGFRQGDRLRNVHWVHTARTNRLIVCDRGDPERQRLQIRVEVAPFAGERLAGRQQLAWRIRVAATLAVHLHAQRVPLQVFVGNRRRTISQGPSGRRELLTMLAEVPLDGEQGAPLWNTGEGVQILIGGGPGSDAIRVEVGDAAARRREGAHRSLEIDWHRPVEKQLEGFWREVRYARKAA